MHKEGRHQNQVINQHTARFFHYLPQVLDCIENPKNHPIFQNRADNVKTKLQSSFGIGVQETSQ